MVSNVKDKLQMSRIGFDEIRQYWIDSNHFKVKNKMIIENVRYLGSYTNEELSPRSICYGLFLEEHLVGVTMLRSWNNKWVRYRTLNIDPRLRGNDIGWDLLMTAYNDYWKGRDLFGWVRRPHYLWSERHGFQPIDGRWHGDHIGVVLTWENIKKINENKGFYSMEPEMEFVKSIFREGRV